MKRFNELSIEQQAEHKPTMVEIAIVQKFIRNMLSIYGQKKIESSGILATEDMRNEQGQPYRLPDGSIKQRMPEFEKICNVYARDILSLSEEEKIKRLRKVKKLYQSDHSGFQWPSDAIAKGCAPKEQFNQMYREKFTAGADLIAQQPLPKSHRLEKLNDPDLEKQGLNFLKDFKKGL
jgi:hypothetical protein